MSAVRVEPLSRSNAGRWAELFGRAASPCFCRYWHFEGTKNDWLAQCAFEPQVNASAMENALAHDADERIVRGDRSAAHAILVCEPARQHERVVAPHVLDRRPPVHELRLEPDHLARPLRLVLAIRPRKHEDPHTRGGNGAHEASP